eukprot:926389_1
MINTVNRANGRNIPNMANEHKHHILSRIFIQKNHSKLYDNTGKLNGKVKRGIQRAIDTLPPATQDLEFDDWHWKEYDDPISTHSIFTLNDKKSTRKRPLTCHDDDTTDPIEEPPRKRSRVPRCRYRDGCEDMRQGHCDFYHTKHELRTMMKDDACWAQNKCINWQKGTCNWNHAGYDMRCSDCNGNHPAIRCENRNNRNTTDTSSKNTEYPRYDPSKQLNNESSLKEIKFKKQFSALNAMNALPLDERIAFVNEYEAQQKRMMNLNSIPVTKTSEWYLKDQKRKKKKMKLNKLNQPE